jgi:hypothetical protein
MSGVVEEKSKKNNFEIKLISKNEAKGLLKTYHYLSNISKDFRSGYNFGCFYEKELIAVAIFTVFPVAELAKGMLGLERNDQDGLFELSRLCIEPNMQKTEHNLASWFLSKCIKKLTKLTKVRVILSYADSNFHSGIVYAASNFTYYGLTQLKKDFFIKKPDGSFEKHSRGKVRGLEGEWRERTRKHRFAIVFDKTLKVKWVVEEWKSKKEKKQ